MIHRDRLTQTFKILASIDSVSRQEAVISAEIQKMLAPMAHEIIVDHAGEKAGSNTGNLIVKIKGSSAVSPLMLNAHMDTVEPGTGVRPQFKNGVFTSDGATILGADDKSAIAIIIETLRILHENNIPHGPLEIVLTICEEIGLLGAKNLDVDLIFAKYGYALDTADTACIVTRAPSAIRFEILVHGKDAHAGVDPEKGINAIMLAARAISQLPLGRIDSETTCNIGMIEAKGATNIVPNRVCIKGEVRSHEESRLEAAMQRIVDEFEKVLADYRKEKHSGELPHMEIQVIRDFRRTFIPENHPVVWMAQQAGKNMGRQIVTRKNGGGSDANVFFENGIVTGVLGTGMKDIHSVRESIRLADMEKTAQLLLEIIALHYQGASAL